MLAANSRLLGSGVGGREGGGAPPSTPGGGFTERLTESGRGPRWELDCGRSPAVGAHGGPESRSRTGDARDRSLPPAPGRRPPPNGPPRSAWIRTPLTPGGLSPCQGRLRRRGRRGQAHRRPRRLRFWKRRSSGHLQGLACGSFQPHDPARVRDDRNLVADGTRVCLKFI